MTTIQSTALGIGDKASESKRKQTLVERKLIERALSVQKTRYNHELSIRKMIPDVCRHLVRRRRISDTLNVSEGRVSV